MRKIVITVIAGLLCLSLAACGKTPEPPVPGIDSSSPSDPGDAPAIAIENYPVVDGSTATLPLARALMSRFTGVSAEKVELIQLHTKTDEAYFNLYEGRADLILVYEGSENTMRTLRAWGASFESKVIGYDALVFLTNESNAVDGLTTEQFQAIYSGKVVNWKDVGGSDQPIIAYQRNIDSGSQTMFLKLVMKDQDVMDAPSEYRSANMGALIESASPFKNEGNAIGFSVYYYVQNMYTLPELKLLEVDGVMPSNDSIRAGDYPFVNPFYVYIRADEPADSPVRQIYDFLTTEEGKAFIEQNGYVVS